MDDRKWYKNITRRSIGAAIRFILLIRTENQLPCPQRPYHHRFSFRPFLSFGFFFFPLVWTKGFIIGLILVEGNKNVEVSLKNAKAFPLRGPRCHRASFTLPIGGYSTSSIVSVVKNQEDANDVLLDDRLHPPSWRKPPKLLRSQETAVPISATAGHSAISCFAQKARCAY